MIQLPDMQYQDDKHPVILQHILGRSLADWQLLDMYGCKYENNYTSFLHICEKVKFLPKMCPIGWIFQYPCFESILFYYSDSTD